MACHRRRYHHGHHRHIIVAGAHRMGSYFRFYRVDKIIIKWMTKIHKTNVIARLRN